MTTTTHVNTNAGQLKKFCECPKDRQSKCKHPWTFRVHTELWGRIEVALRKYLKMRGAAVKIGDVAAGAFKIVNKGDAEAVVLVIRNEIAAKIDPRKPLATSAPAPEQPAAEPAGDRTVKAAGEAIVLAHGADLANPAELRQYYGRIAAVAVTTAAGPAPFGSLAVADVTGDHVLEAFRTLTATGGNSYKRKYRRMLRKLFAVALRKRWIGESPIADLELKAGVCAMRNERIPAELEARLIKAAGKLGEPGDRLADLIVAAIETGARKGELLAIQVRDVNLEAGVIEIAAREKGGSKKGLGKGRLVPITPKCAAILEPAVKRAAKHGEKAYVFGTNDGGRIHQVIAVWEKALLLAHGIEITYGPKGTPRPTEAGKNLSKASRAAVRALNGGNSFNFHDLRHEAALRWHEGSGSLRKPLELNAIAELLGHADLAQLRVYLGIKNQGAIAAFKLAAGVAPFRVVKGGKKAANE